MFHMFQNVPNQKVPKCAKMFQEVPRGAKMFQGVPNPLMPSEIPFEANLCED